MPGPLPSTGVEAFLFDGVANGASSNNAADYIVTAGAAVFTNFAGSTGTITKPPAGCPWDRQDTPNGFVDITDMFKLFGRWLAPGTCDFNGNNVGFIEDLFELFGNWGACP